MNPDLLTAPSGMVYPLWQCGSGAPLLLLHGFTGSHETWRHVVPHLSTNHVVLTLDLPGHGRSELPMSRPWNFASILGDLAWLIASLPDGAADVLGYSMGGRLALALAATHPERVRKLVLESASPGIANEQERQERQQSDERLADRLLEHGLAAFVAEWEHLPMWQSQATLDEADRVRQRQIRLGHTASGLAASLRATGTGAQPSYWEHLATLRPPTLLIAGARDDKFARIAAAMHEVIPDSRLETVPDAGHAVHLEQTDRYVHHLSTFLNQPASSEMHAQRSQSD